MEDILQEEGKNTQKIHCHSRSHSKPKKAAGLLLKCEACERKPININHQISKVKKKNHLII